MLKEKVGVVTEKEKREIEKLYERKMALQELIVTLDKPSLLQETRNELYEKIVKDMAHTKSLFEKWWGEKSEQYNWKVAENGNWMIDFETREIFLVRSNA